MSHDIQKIEQYLSLIEQQLKALELWGGEENTPEAHLLASDAPFCIDTLEFHQWLEYVLIKRMRHLIAHDLPLPQSMLIHPYAQEFYKEDLCRYNKLIMILKIFDKLF